MSELKLKNGIVLTEESITPKIAAKMIESNSKNNRKLRRNVYEGYARAMEAGAWYEKPTAICFMTDGTLGNGHHTLHAIVKSGKDQQHLVARNVPQDVIAAMDIGAKRSVADIGRFMGHGEFTSRRVAMLRVMVYGPTDSINRQFPELFDKYTEHEEAIEFTFNNIAQRKGVSAVVMAMIARAWYRVDKERLAKFCEMLNTGMASASKDNAVIRLRDWIASNPPAMGSNARSTLASKSTSAIKNFCEMTPIKSIIGIAWNNFSLPGEKKRKSSTVVVKGFGRSVKVEENRVSP